jgi:hypothetical protein
MNRIEKGLFALKKERFSLRNTLELYKRYRKDPDFYFNQCTLEYKGKDYMKWFESYREQLAGFKNIHAGEDCFIIGNGPSLNKMDLGPLSDYYTFGLNKIFLIFKKIQLELSYLVSVNPYVIQQSVEEFNGLAIPKFLSFKAAQSLDLKDDSFLIFTKGGFDFSPDLQKTINEGYTVTFVAMQVAYYMGFKRVFLIGVDHNFKQKGKPNELQTMNEDDANHFDPDYFKNLPWQLADLEASEVAYRIAKMFFERNGREIIDATVDGKLQVYQKMAYAEALKTAGKRSQSH